MAGGPTKINPPNSHSSNPIHKAATKTDPKPAAAATQTSSAQTKESAPTEQTEEQTPPAGSGSESHDVNKTAVAVFAVAVVGLLLLSFR